MTAYVNDMVLDPRVDAISEYTDSVVLPAINFLLQPIKTIHLKRLQDKI